MKYEQKLCKCPVCETEYMNGLNHEGSFWVECKNCHFWGQQICVTPAALAYIEQCPKIVTQLTGYYLDISKAEDARFYKQILKSLEGRPKFEVTGPEPWRKNMIRKFREENRNSVTLMANFAPGGQWNTVEGYRIHDWHEHIFPNKKIKEGYFLNISQEMKNLTKAAGNNYYDGW